MVAPIQTMPPELVAIISHFELQRTPWWSDAVDSVILIVLFRSTTELTADEIRRTILSNYHANLTQETLIESLSRLESRVDITKLPQGSYRLSQDTAEKVDAAIAQWEVARSNARTIFVELIDSELPDINSDAAWEKFQVNLLIPAIVDLGAQAWNFIVNNEVAISDSIEPHIRRYLQQFPSETRTQLRSVVYAFLDPRIDSSRSFIADTLSAYFFMTACGLSEEEIRRIEKILANPFEVTAVLDVDLILAFNELFDSKTNELVSNLLELQASERFFNRLEFAVTTMTLNEAQAALHVAAAIGGAEESDDAIILEGPLSITVQGIMASFLNSDRKSHLYFEAGLTSLSYASRMYLVPAGSDRYTDEEVLSEARTYKKMVVGAEISSPPDSSDRRYLHDIALRSTIKELRGGEWPALFQNKYWLVTNNNALLRYDAYTTKRTGSSATCVSPLTLLQMLRLWVPRSEGWDRTAISSVRLPFVSLGQRGKLDRAALQVLRALARNEYFARDEERLLTTLLNEELKRTISDANKRMVSDANRQEISSGEIQEVRAELQTLRDENETLRADLQMAKARAQNRKFVTRMFAVAGSFSVILTVLTTIFLRENVSLFSSTVTASVTGACFAGLVTLAAARLYVAAATEGVAQEWRGRLRRWLGWFIVAVLLNLGIAVLASAVYDAAKGRLDL